MGDKNPTIAQIPQAFPEASLCGMEEYSKETQLIPTSVKYGQFQVYVNSLNHLRHPGLYKTIEEIYNLYAFPTF